MGDVGNNRGGLGGAVGHLKADSDPFDPTRELSDLGAVYLCNQRRFNYANDTDCAGVCREGFRNGFVGGGGAGFVKRRFREAKIRNTQRS